MSITKHAKNLIRNGNKKQAEKLLINYLKNTEDDEKAWLLLAECVEQKRHKINCLKRAQAINPNNKKTNKYIALLNAGKNPKIYRVVNYEKLIGLLIFGLVLPFASIFGAKSLLSLGNSNSLTVSSSSPIKAQPSSIEIAIVETEAEEKGAVTVVSIEVEVEIIKAEVAVIETVKEIPLKIPNIPSAYCVPKETNLSSGKVIAVVDAQNILVNVDGEIIGVRYIGIETPAEDELGGAKALEFNRRLEGQKVLLVSDDSSTNDGGGMLSYVFVEDIFINYQMAEQGLATVSLDVGDFPCKDFFLVAEKAAEENEIGIWEYVDVRMDPADWKTWPVIPLFSKNAIEIIQDGVDAGRDPQHFSIMGDCQAPEWLMFGLFEYQSFVIPEEYEYLQTTMDAYSGQWSRNNVTVESGNTVASLFSPPWADRYRCGSAETPIDCEIRINNPAVAMIMLGTNWPQGQDESFDLRLRQTISYLIEQNVLPILVTKGDATEPDYPLNLIIAQVSYDYDIPLWNFWASIQDLYNHGMDPNDYRNIHISSNAFPIKRWTGLQTLDALWEAVNAQQN